MPTTEATMGATRDEILNLAMELSEADRLSLAAELMGSVSDDLPGWSIHDDGFASELESRAIDGSPGVSWEDVRAQLRADLDQ